MNHQDLMSLLEAVNTCAGYMKATYDAYISQGFTPEQAMTFCCTHLQCVLQLAQGGK